jgi:rhamnogalacturonyl hydrolase YesR
MAWEQGVAAQACLEMGDMDTVVLLAREAVLRQDIDGRLAEVASGHAITDPASNGEAVLTAARLTGDSKLLAGAEKMLDFLLRRAHRNKNGILYHFNPNPDGQMWIDSMFMAPPFLAFAGHAEEAMKQIRGWRKLLWNPSKRLFSHIWNDSKGAFGREDCWGVGNGWAAAGMASVLRKLPAAMESEKKELAENIKALIDGCLTHQRPDGLFHNVVDNPDSFVETNLAQMLAYSIFHGCREGWLDPSYRAKAESMRLAVHPKVDRYGLVQDVCGSPDFDHPGTATEGQAFFILMEAAYCL